MTYNVFGGTLNLTQSINLGDRGTRVCLSGHGCGVLVFRDSNSDSRVWKFKTPDSDSGTKNLGLRLRAQSQTPTPTL